MADPNPPPPPPSPPGSPGAIAEAHRGVPSSAARNIVPPRADISSKRPGDNLEASSTKKPTPQQPTPSTGSLPVSHTPSAAGRFLLLPTPQSTVNITNTPPSATPQTNLDNRDACLNNGFHFWAREDQIAASVSYVAERGSFREFRTRFTKPIHNRFKETRSNAASIQRELDSQPHTRSEAAKMAAAVEDVERKPTLTFVD